MSRRAGATIDVLDALGLDVDAYSPLIEWARLDGAAWVTDAARSSALVSYTIGYGRGDAWSKVAPSQCTVVAAIPRAPAPVMGEVFRLRINAAAADALGLSEDDAALFTGQVTDPKIDPKARTWTVVAVHTTARSGRTSVDLTAAGTQSTGERVSAILAASGDVVGLVDDLDDDPDLAQPDAIASARQLLDVVSDSTLGQLVPQLDGTVDWHGPDHRRGVIASMTLSSGEVLNDLTWEQHVGTIVNSVTVNYVGGSVTVTDPASIDRDGEYPITVTTSLTDHDDAESLGSLIVGRRATPAWDIPTLNVDVGRAVAASNRPRLLALRFGSRITLAGLPDVGAWLAGSHDVYVEGIAHKAARWSWQMGLSVTDPALSGVVLRWMDVDPDLTWGDVDPDLRWLDLARVLTSGDIETGPTPDFLLDGGDAGTTAYSRTFDGGNAGTSSYTRTIDDGGA